MTTMKLEINNINPEDNNGCDISTNRRVTHQRRLDAKEDSMSKKGTLAVVVLGALLCGALVAFAAVSGESQNNAGRMNEVVVSGHAPAMELKEVVVYGSDQPSAGGAYGPLEPQAPVSSTLIPEVVSTASRLQPVIAAYRFERTELN